MLPKRFGDSKRLEHSGPDGEPVAVRRHWSNEELVNEAIRLGLVERLPPALREMAEKKLSTGEATKPSEAEIERNWREDPNHG